MKQEIIKVSKDLENGLIDEKQARRLLLGLFGFIGEQYHLDIKRVDKMLNNVSKESWIASCGNDIGWKEWWIKRNKLNLNKL